MHDNAVILSREGEVGRLRPHQTTVWHGNDIILTRSDTSNQHRLLDDETLGIAIFDEVAHMEGAHIGHHHACHHIADDRRGAQRDDDTDEYRYALEHLRIAVGQQGPYHDKHERVEQEAQDDIGGAGPVSIESIDLQVAVANLIHQIMDTLDQIAEADHNDDYLEEVGQEA